MDKGKRGAPRLHTRATNHQTSRRCCLPGNELLSDGVDQSVNGLKRSCVVQLYSRQSLDGLTQLTDVIAPVSSLPAGVVVRQHAAWVMQLVLRLLLVMKMMREIWSLHDHDDLRHHDEQRLRQTSVCFHHHHPSDA